MIRCAAGYSVLYRKCSIPVRYRYRYSILIILNFNIVSFAAHSAARSTCTSTRYLLEGVPGVAGVLPPLDGVRLVVPGVPGVGGGARPCALPARGRPGVLVVRLGVPLGVRGVPAADVRPTRGPEDRRPGRPF